MKLVIQRVSEAKVTIDNKINGQIDNGLVILVGFIQEDNELIIDKMINKLINLRIFNDQEDNMNLSLLDIKGSILSISQFTLYANIKKGNRPSLSESLNKEDANNLYNLFNLKLQAKNIDVQTGIFGSKMSVELINEGPVTIILDSKEV
ncbi:MAG: D-aminoacyl-tRNA deacylase [Bacilli bacterium]|nr:D-aminoacyl-tRNA deacylase [Bacilli bacterium]